MNCAARYTRKTWALANQKICETSTNCETELLKREGQAKQDPQITIKTYILSVIGGKDSGGNTNLTSGRS